MQVGIQINRFNYPGGDARIRDMLKEVALKSEAASVDSLWVMDHFFQIGHLGPKTDPMLEAYTTLGFLAGLTAKVKLGTLVTGVIYREPALLIKAVTALDVLSNGRAYFGIGAGWNDEEAMALALPNPLTAKRFERLEDTLRLAKQMWSDDSSEFNGKMYHLPEPINHPQALTKPHPPILIGGGGEQRTLKLVAQYADACNLFWLTGQEEVAHKLAVLRQHCEKLGRNYDDIEKTVAAGLSVAKAANDPKAIISTAKDMHKLGLTHMILAIGTEDDLSDYDKLGAVVKRLHDI
jgi:F420-dependent oxidoreductase-like protein